MQQRRSTTSSAVQPSTAAALRERLVQKLPAVLDEKIPGTLLDDIKPRCRCHLCHSEQVRSTQTYWKELMGLNGECYKCEGYVAIETVFLNRDRDEIASVTPECTADELLSCLQAVAKYRYGDPLNHSPPITAPPALATTILKGTTEEVERLVNPLNINCLVERGMTALFFACYHGKKEMVKCLLNSGADVHAKSKDAMRAMHGATSGKNVEIVKLLHANGSRVNDIDANGFSPLHHACMEGQLDIDVCKFLIDNGAKVDRPTMTKATPLHLAARNGNLDVVKLLIENKAPIDAEDAFGRTPLANAIFFGKVTAGKALLDGGANLTKIKKDLTIPTWLGGEPARDIVDKDQQIAQLEAQIQTLTANRKRAPQPSPETDKRFLEIDEARKGAILRCRALETRIQEQEGQVATFQDRSARLQREVNAIETENDKLKSEQPLQREAEELNNKLMLENSKFKQMISDLIQELAQSREAYMKRAAENIPIPWQSALANFHQQTPQFEENKRLWEQAQSTLAGAEQKLSTMHHANFLELIKAIETRNEMRKQLHSLSCAFEEKSRHQLSELQTFMEMVQPHRAQNNPGIPQINLSDQPTLSQPITQEQLQRQREWQHNAAAEFQRAANSLNINHKAEETCQQLAGLLTEVQNLTVKSTDERKQQEKRIVKQELALQLIRTLQDLKTNYQRACKRLTHAQEMVILEESAQDTLVFNRAAFINARDAYLEKLLEIRDYINDFEEFRPFVNEAPENPLLSLKDFQVVSQQNQSILQATRNGFVYALKQREKALLRREFHILKRIQHPFVQSAETLFSDSSSTAVLVMPWMSGGSLDQWLINAKPSEDSLRDLFRSVLDGLACVHAKGIVHGDLRLQNILVDNNDLPRLCDFDQSIDSSYPFADTVLELQPCDQQALEYSAPELRSQPPAPKSQAADIYAFGGCIWKVFFANNPCYMRDSDAHPEVPATTLPGLRLALEWLLKRDPQQRPTAHSALQFPFFTAKSLISEEPSTTTRERLEAFRASIKLVYANAQNNENRPEIPVLIPSKSMLENIADILHGLYSSLDVRCVVRFEGEEGIDHGALTTSMYVRFLNEAFKSPFFQQGSAGKCLPCANQKLDSKSFKIYHAVGIALARVLIEELAVRVPCASSMFKFLQMDRPVCAMSDLEEFDPQQNRNMLQLLSPGGDCSLYDYELVGEPPQDVTAQNKQSFVNKYIQWQLMDSRKPALSAMRQGFTCLGEDINRHLRLLTWRDVRLLLSGTEDMQPQQVLDRLVFKDFPAHSNTPGYLRNVIASFGPEELMRFLGFVIAQETLPVAAEHRPIKIVNVAGSDARFPVSRACFWQLDIPEYSSEAALRERLLLAMETELTFTRQ